MPRRCEGRHGSCACDEPDQLGVERAHQQLAFGVRLVELAEPDRHVAADDDRTPAGLDDDHLRAGCVARRRDEPEPGKQLELAVDRHVPHAGRIDPLADRVVVLAARVVELPTLDVDRLAGEEVVAAAVVEVQVGVDDDVDAGEVEVLLAQRAGGGDPCRPPAGAAPSGRCRPARAHRDGR